MGLRGDIHAAEIMRSRTKESGVSCSFVLRDGILFENPSPDRS